MKLWDAFLEDLEKKFGKTAVDKWLRPLKITHFDACNLYLEAEHSFQISWFEEHIRGYAKTHFLNPNAHPIKIHFAKQKKHKSKPLAQKPPIPFAIEPTPIDPGQTFSNFLFDTKGSLTVEFCKKLSPGAYNPLFIHGRPGTGKTHLLNACANKWRCAGLNVFYVHAETFTEHVVSAIRSSEMQQFRNIYRNPDILIIDDIHCLTRRTATQEELFHTFNTLHTSGRQIVLASHLLPSQMEEIEPRLISRFEWGIVLEVQPLSEEKMKQVLKNKANLHRFPLSEPIATFLYANFSQTSNTLMRALDALFLRHKGQSPITLSEAERLLFDLLNEEKKEQLTPEKILRATSAYFGIKTGDILGKSRAKEFTLPRKIAMYLCRKHLNLPYLSIGKFFQRDHSTVMTSIDQIEKKGAAEEFSAAVNEISTNLIRS